ncbi:MAG: DNA repair protein RecO [Spirochaetaceae bacterium]|nr:DNA repair protein RecO [Myxococcales bacterium]MCB9723442.1 DNA repair protein RecO [Spirochaetaceae bacterium]
MSGVRCEAVLLRSVEYGESDRIVHLLTSDHGRLTAIAKGARRSHRRFPGTLDVFNRLAIEGRLKPRASMAFLEQARLVDAFLGLRDEPRRYALASFLVEMLDRLSPEGVAGSEAARLFRFTIESLDLVARVRPDATLRVLLELRALDALGLRPELGRCVRCGRVPAPDVAPGHVVQFHVADGGIVCTPCALRLDGLVPIELGTLRRLAQGLDGTLEALGEARLEGRALAQAARLLFRFQRFHVGVELRSERFLEEVLPVSAPGAA